MVDWDKYINFSKSEFDCSQTGENGMKEDFIALLQDIRSAYGRPINISSGYRSPEHSIETAKDKPGEHTKGMGADIAIYGSDAIELVRIALNLGVPRIGVKQHGPKPGRFIHLGMATEDFPSPWIWSYK